MIFTLVILLSLTSASTIRNGDFDFDPYFGLELLLVTSCVIFAIILLILLAILYPPTCFCAKKAQFSGIPDFPYRFLPRRPSLSSSEGSYGTMVEESFYIPAERCRGRDQIRKKILDTRPPMSRTEGVINSTHMPNMPEVTFNRYFPGLQEISRISNMNTLQRTPTAFKVARPYRKPRIPSKNIPQKPLRSILKNSTNGTLPKTSVFVV